MRHYLFASSLFVQCNKEILNSRCTTWRYTYYDINISYKGITSSIIKALCYIISVYKDAYKELTKEL